MTTESPLIRDEDLRVESIHPPSRGGQHVGTPHSKIRVTHIPSGLVAECDSDRSQHRNRQICLDMILSGLTSPHFRG